MGFKLGYIGFGEAAYNMGKGLKKEGFEDICAFDVALNMGGAAKDVFLHRAEDAGVTVAQSAQEVVDSCEVVVLCVPAKFTASTA
ncbi:MAG: NAD(P)-dependent oxidoreductase, partial [Pyramidobacter sp.]|nr:NAD(P)-dependent oxidoreductase [Pyramidobacter sp.]